jgi:hypothetical protein
MDLFPTPRAVEVGEYGLGLNLGKGFHKLKMV